MARRLLPRPQGDPQIPRARRSQVHHGERPPSPPLQLRHGLCIQAHAPRPCVGVHGGSAHHHTPHHQDLWLSRLRHKRCRRRPLPSRRHRVPAPAPRRPPLGRGHLPRETPGEALGARAAHGHQPEGQKGRRAHAQQDAGRLGEPAAHGHHQLPHGRLYLGERAHPSDPGHSHQCAAAPVLSRGARVDAPLHACWCAGRLRHLQRPPRLARRHPESLQ
mmetsp:Transcript_100957/g.301208  ORF Transcript_100957/g.301208 Transcript_100957/m.301208 type:complete len:218 (-) Transcript_100957:381-1034(-)